MKFVYPEKDKKLDKHLSSSQYGNYPLSSYNTWHGGIHAETKLSPLVAISDARIIAYRLPENYLNTEHDWPQMYSNGFVLLQHTYKSEKEQELNYYTLYHHVASKIDITNNLLEVPDYLSSKITKVNAKNTPKGVRGREATVTEGSTKGAETVIIPKNTVLTKNSEEELCEWAKTYNTKKASTGSSSRYYSFCYHNTFTNEHLYDIHIHSSCVKLVEEDQYKVSYNKDTNTLTNNSNRKTTTAPLNAALKEGVLLYETKETDFGNLGKGVCIGVIPFDKEVTITEGSISEDKKWAKVDGYTGYIQLKDIKEQKTWASNLQVDTVVACDKPVKAGDIIAYVGAFGFKGKEQKYSSHIELFSDDDDATIKSFLQNKVEDGSENLTRYSILTNATLEPYVKKTKELKKGTPVKVTKVRDDYVRVKIMALIKPLTNGTHISVQYSSPSVYARDTVVRKSRIRYKIVEEQFDYVNEQFNGLLSENTFLHWESKIDSTQRNMIFAPPNWDKEFWIDKAALATTAEQIITFSLETELKEDISHIYVGEPYPPHERGNTFKKDIELKGKPEISVTDDAGKKWLFITNSYDFQQNCYQHIGWIKEDDAHIEQINPFHWESLGFKHHDGGSEYVYTLEDYNKSPSTHAFIEEAWRMIDTDGDTVLTPMELLKAQGNPKTSNKLGKMVVKHKNEWSYEPEKIKTEAKEFYKIGIDLEEDPDKKKILEQERDKDLEHLVKKVENLMLAKQLKEADASYVPETTEADQEYEEKKTAIDTKYTTFTTEGTMSEENKVKKDAELDALDKKYKKGAYKPEDRKLPNLDMVWHFNPINFVRQMRVMYGKSDECYCNRNLTESEVKSIIITMRKSETEVYKGANKENLFFKNNCPLPESDKTFKKFTEELNTVFSNYDINTCIRRMHFLAQIYHETDRLRTTKEYQTEASYAPYTGRGLMQLTWKSNYIKYKDYSNVECVTDYETIANSLKNSFDSAGWFWKKGKALSVGSTWTPPSSSPPYVKAYNAGSYPKTTITYDNEGSSDKYGTIDLNLLADDDYVDIISWLVNGGSNGLQERRDYLKELKKVFKYNSKCISNNNKTDTESALDNGVTLHFTGETADEASLSTKTKNILKEVGKISGNNNIYITSTARTPYDQARIMYENCKSTGVAEQKTIYASTGDQVIDVYSTENNLGKSKEDVIKKMEEKIKDIGPSKVSKHLADPEVMNTFDISYGNLTDKSKFWDEMKKRSELDKILEENSCYHIQINQ